MSADLIAVLVVLGVLVVGITTIATLTLIDRKAAGGRNR
jgi:hypothetical protein